MGRQRSPCRYVAPLSFAYADFDLCFNLIDKNLRTPSENFHFPSSDLKAYSETYNQVRCKAVREIPNVGLSMILSIVKANVKDAPPTPEEYCKLTTRVESASDYYPPKRSNQRRRIRGERPNAGLYCKPHRNRDSCSREHLASRNSRQSFRHEAKRLHDLKPNTRLGCSDVASWRSSYCALPLL